MIGYEARARITADVAGFVAAQREGARAAGTFAAAMRDLNTQLSRTSQLAAQSATGMRTFSQAAQQTSQRQSQAASSAQAMAQAAQQGAMAYTAAQVGAQQASAAMAQNTEQQRQASQATTQNTQTQRVQGQSLNQLGQQMEKLSNQRRILVEQQRNQGQLNNSEQAALATLRDRLQQLGQRYGQLSDEQRQTVDSARAMAAAQNTVRESVSTMSREIRESVREQERNNQAQANSQQALRAMGQELARLIPQQQQYRAAQAQGATLSREQARAAAEVDTRLGQLTQQYMRLNATQRATVNAQRDLASASRLASQATQEQSAAQVRLEQTGRLSTSQIQQMGREIARLIAQRERLETAQRQGVALNRQETDSLGAVQGRLRELSGIYNRLEVEQRQAVTTARQLAQANQSLSASTQQVAGGTRAQEQAAEGLNGSLWSLRSAVGDATSSMQQLWGVSQRVTTALWDNYSAQEMAIAQISRVSQATVSELDSIVDSVRQMSTEIPIAFEELGEIAMLGSQVGIANDSLGVFTETVALFAATSEVSADETATMMARIMEMTNLSQTHGQDAVRNLGSAVAYLGSNALATDREILKTVESIATMTTQVGFSAEATIGLGSAMASLVIRPEIARGASQRVFLQLGEAIQGTGAEMETLTEVTGMTQEALLEMSDSNFEEYFFTVMEALSGVAQEGGDLIPIIRQMGIINTRDAEVVARLAANYGVLETSVAEAGHAFESGQYLYEESDRIFNTLTARVQILANVWSNFMFAAVESIAPFITRVVEAATGIIQMADAMGAAPILGWGVLILGIAGTLGLLASAVGMASQGVLAFVGLWNMWATRAGAATAANVAAAASTRALATAQGQATAAGLAQASALSLGTVASRGFAVSMAAATASARAFMLANPVLLLGAIAAGLLAASVASRDFSSSMERAAEKNLEANRTFQDAAGGMQALQSALLQDTERWQEAQAAAEEHMVTLNDGTRIYGEASQEILKYGAFRTESTRDMVKADQEARKSAQELEDAQRSASDGIVSSSESAGSATEQMSKRYQDSLHPMLDATGDLNYAQQGLRDSAEETAEAFEGATMAIGTATRDWGAEVLNAALLESAMWDNVAALEAVADAGINMGTALTLEMTEAGGGAEYLGRGIATLQEDMNGLQQAQSDFRINLNSWTVGMLDLRTDTDIAIEGLRDMSSATASLSQAIENSDLTTQQMIPVLSDMAEELGYTSEELGGMDDAQIEAAASAEVLGDAVTGIGLTVGEFAEALATFMDPLGAWTEGLQTMNDNLDEGDAAFTRFIDNGENNFDTYLQGMYDMRDAQLEWSTNLLELSEQVPPQVIGDLAAMGEEGAGLVADLVDATDEQVERWVDLWEQGGAELLTDYAVIWESFRVQAFEGGDAGGLEFVNSLMGQVATGELSMSEAVDQMIEYAEENFDNADPTMDFYADNTEAINELNDTLTQVRDAIRDSERVGDMDIEPSVVTGPSFWDTIVTAWNTITNWWGSGPSLSVSPSVSSTIPKYADGGWVGGNGGPRQDNQLIAASAGEFMVNAASAARNAQLLEWINSDGNMPNRQEFVPQAGLSDNANSPTASSRVRAMPDFGQTASANVRRQHQGERIVVNVKNYYPQAEPTSVTTNRALQYVAGLNGVL